MISPPTWPRTTTNIFTTNNERCFCRHVRRQIVSKSTPPKIRKLTPAKQRRLDQLLELNAEGTIALKDRQKLEQLVAEAEKLMQGFLHLVKGEDASDLPEDDRERLEVMGGISEFPMRVKCATLAWHTYKNAVEEGAT